MFEIIHQLKQSYDDLWELRDKRMDGLPGLSSPIPTILICLTYVYIVKIAGPKFMKHREPYNIRTFLVFYNAFQVALSTYIFVNLWIGGWGNGKYSFICQPVDYSDSWEGLQMTHCSYIYYLSKFTEFVDTFAFVLRKKFTHISALHVIHHGIMPLSIWPGLRWTPGGHATFFGFLNTFIHIFMYLYYMFAALELQKYIVWKRQVTNMQMIQFIGIFVHSIQLLFVEPCGFPIVYGYIIAGHAILFFALFSQFYLKVYLSGKSKQHGSQSNGVKNDSNGHTYNTRSKKDL